VLKAEGVLETAVTIACHQYSRVAGGAVSGGVNDARQAASAQDNGLSLFINEDNHIP
jgi:hypothetical protein